MLFGGAVKGKLRADGSSESIDEEYWIRTDVADVEDFTVGNSISAVDSDVAFFHTVSVDAFRHRTIRSGWGDTLKALLSRYIEHLDRRLIFPF